MTACNNIVIINALEFYAGIGGLHRALDCSPVHARVVAAYDWDPAARQVYEHNYPNSIFRRADISQLQAADLVPLHAQLWLSSPSCQPYTVLNPNAQGEADPRAASFLHLVTVVLPALAATQNNPEYILIENVAGFETSTTRQTLLTALHGLRYHVIELLLTPLQFGIPNSRLRYYLLARLHRPFAHSRAPPGAHSRVWRHLPTPGGADWVDERHGAGVTLEAYLDELTEEEEKEYAIPDRVLEKRGRLFDIVLPTSSRTCCFIRAYTHLAERAGSILQMNTELDTTETFNRYADFTSQTPSPSSAEALSILGRLRLRYFTPTELLRIFHFNPPRATPRRSAPSVPPTLGMSTGSPGQNEMETAQVNREFGWPASTTRKTRYRLIGNSVNVDVVARLLRYLVLD